MPFFSHPSWLCGDLSYSFDCIDISQLVFHDNYSTCGYIFYMFAVGGELHVLLFCHLDFPSLNYIPNRSFFPLRYLSRRLSEVPQKSVRTNIFKSCVFNAFCSHSYTASMIVSPQIQVFVYSVFVEDSLYARTILITGVYFPSICLSVCLSV